MLGTPHLGLIVPASNSVMEPDFHNSLGALATISTWRIVLESVTREAEIKMLEEELPRCLEGLRPTRPEIAVFGCTSAGSLDGLKHDSAIARSIEQATGARTVTVMGAVIEQLRALAPRQVVVLTPYCEELTASVAGCVSEAGFEVSAARGMGIANNLEIGRVPPSDIVHFAATQMAGRKADCLFLSCTNWQALQAIKPLRGSLGIPVISSNQAAIESVRALAQKVRAEAASMISPGP